MKKDEFRLECIPSEKNTALVSLDISHSNKILFYDTDLE